MSDKDLENAVLLDAASFTDANVRGVLETCLEWRNKEPLVYTVLRNENGELCGYINCMPVTAAAYAKLRAGEVFDIDLRGSDLANFADYSNSGKHGGETLNMLFVSINVAPRERISRHRPVMKLLCYWSDMISQMQTRGTKFGHMILDCVTPEGEALANRIPGAVVLPLKSSSLGGVQKEVLVQDVLRYINTMRRFISGTHT